MRVAVLGGTVFIGAAGVRSLERAGHELLIIHRGEHLAPERSIGRHVHVSREDLASAAGEIHDFAPEAIVDTRAMSARDAELALAVWPANARLVVLSSADVYRAYGSREAGLVTEAMPLDETSPVREGRYPYRGSGRPGTNDYEKLDVEPLYLARGGVALRLGFIYGPHDPQHREEFILRRVRAGRTRIPIGAANWLLSRGFVDDCGEAVRLAVETPGIEGEVFNITESKAPTARLWAQQILAAAGSDAELVRVSERLLPADMAMTTAIGQHMQIDSSKARQVLGWRETAPEEAVRESVAWHLAHPPADASADFSDDEAALAGSA